jgi:hypothetical protein
MTDCNANAAHRLSPERLVSYDDKLSVVEGYIRYSFSTLDSTGRDFSIEFVELLRRNACNGIFGVAEQGFYVIPSKKGPRNDPKEGNVIIILDGGKVPAILRVIKISVSTKRGTFRVAPVAYVQDFVDGEART